jgi:ribulose bisphosphate carboxylase small subunit
MLTLADPDPITLQQILTYLPSISGGAVLALVTYAWTKGYIVTRRELDAAERRTEEWKALALRSQGIGERTSRAAETATSLLGAALNSTPPTGPGQ